MEKNIRSLTVFTMTVLFSYQPFKWLWLYSSFSWLCIDEFHIFSLCVLLNINCNSRHPVMVQQQHFSRVCTMSWCCKSLIYFLYFSNVVCPSSQRQHIYSMQTSVLTLGKQIGLSTYLKKNGGINWHEFACFDVWISFVLCVLFVYEFRVSVRVKDKISIVPLLFLTRINNWSHIEYWLYFSEEKIIVCYFLPVFSASNNKVSRSTLGRQKWTR